MGWIRPGALVCLALCAWSVGAQDADAKSSDLAGEFRRLETESRLPEKSGAQRRALLTDLARLRRLTGDLEGAAVAFTDAAFAEAGRRDDDALLDAAECRIAQGEWEKAAADVKTVLLTGRGEPQVRRARYLGAQIEALSPGGSGIGPLASFVDDPVFAARRPGTLFLLWRISGDPVYRDRLLGDHGASPEARIAGTASQDSGVSLKLTPFWLLFPGRGTVTVGSGGDAPRQETATPAEGTVLLQIGLFRDEANAQDLVRRLAARGFSAQLADKTVRGEKLIAVAVDPGADIDATVLRLKDAGFEAFPLY